MQIKKIDTKKEEYMDLLLDADPEEEMISEYLQD